MLLSQNYSGVKAPVRKKVAEVSTEAYARYVKGDTTAIPHWMQIRDGDSEKQREKKMRAMKAFKKKMRYVSSSTVSATVLRMLDSAAAGAWACVRTSAH